jgi:hypothetical protein
MQINLKKLVGVTAIALPAFVVGAGVANVATPAPSIPGPTHTVQAPAGLGPTQIQLVDDGWGCGDWGWGHGGWGWGHDGWGWGHDGWGWGH